MALYAFDGTGNDDLDRHCRETSVLEFFRAYVGGPRNDDPALKIGSLYLKGIGTRSRGFVGYKPAEAFGVGGHRRVRQAIDRLENNFEVGDTVVDVIGFSRGAALAVSFANELAGKLPRVSIRFMDALTIVLSAHQRNWWPYYAIMERLVLEAGSITPNQAILVVSLAKTSNLLFGGTADFEVAREFAAQATYDEKLALARCLFAVAASEDSISMTEETEIHRILNQLKIEPADLTALRIAHRSQLPGITPRPTN